MTGLSRRSEWEQHLQELASQGGPADDWETYRDAYEPEVEDAARAYFHGCPHCPVSNGPEDMFNAGKTNFAACHTHRTVWCLGSILDTHHETAEEQRARWAQFQHYTYVSMTQGRGAHGAGRTSR
jgi:hypothetical protein